MRYKLTLSYDGTEFAGFQKQPNQRTVEGVLTHVVNKISKTDSTDPIKIFGAGRTDAGVHAMGQVIHFDMSNNMTETSMLKAFNSLLPLDIKIIKSEIVSDDFHARFDAKGKHYQYRLYLGNFMDPFKRNYVGHWKYSLDFNLIQQAIKNLEGEHDFSSFVAAGSIKKSNVRTIYSADVSFNKAESELIFDFTGNGFLYNMVRIMIAVLTEIGSRRRPFDDINKLFVLKDRQFARLTAPASGLYLKKVFY